MVAADRARQFPTASRSQFIEWEARAVKGNVYVDLDLPDYGKVQVRVTPDDAYEFKESIERAIDQAWGL
jgi:hypothetical protein